jgi:uncharacterized protein YjbJ (UPF0337 family)
MRNKDEGKSKPIKGAVKDRAGELINDPDLVAKGETGRPNGKMQEKAGKARWKVGKTIKKAGKVISRKR